MAVTILSIIQVLSGAVLILFVLGQSGKHSGLGMISGASDSFLSKNKAKSACIYHYIYISPINQTHFSHFFAAFHWIDKKYTRYCFIILINARY